MFIFTGSLIIAIFCNGCPSIATQQTIGKLTEIQQITVKHEFQWWGRWNWTKRWFNGSRGENPSKTRENKSTNWCSEKVHFIIHCYSLKCNAWSVILEKVVLKVHCQNLLADISLQPILTNIQTEISEDTELRYI